MFEMVMLWLSGFAIGAGALMWLVNNQDGDHSFHPHAIAAVGVFAGVVGVLVF